MNQIFPFQSLFSHFLNIIAWETVFLLNSLEKKRVQWKTFFMEIIAKNHFSFCELKKMTSKNVIIFDNSLRCIRHCIFVLNCGSNTNYCNIILPYIESNLPKLDWIFRFWSFFLLFCKLRWSWVCTIWLLLIKIWTNSSDLFLKA